MYEHGAADLSKHVFNGVRALSWLQQAGNKI